MRSQERDCPECGGTRQIREFFFPFADERPAGKTVILARCAGCGLRRFFPAGGEDMPVRAVARRAPGRFLRAVSARGSGGILLAPQGTELTGDEALARWSEWPRGEDLELVHLWFSLEESADPYDALARVKVCIRPGGRLMITAVNACALGCRLLGTAWPWYEPFRQRVLFDPVNLRNILRRSGFGPGKLSFSPFSPVIRAEAEAS